MTNVAWAPESCALQMKMTYVDLGSQFSRTLSFSAYEGVPSSMAGRLQHQLHALMVHDSLESDPRARCCLFQRCLPGGRRGRNGKAVLVLAAVAEPSRSGEVRVGKSAQGGCKPLGVQLHGGLVGWQVAGEATDWADKARCPALHRQNLHPAL
jgi:hypothetical protein